VMTAAIWSADAPAAPAADTEDDLMAPCCSSCPQDDFEDPCWNVCRFSC
jgi:hypothetical protein